LSLGHSRYVGGGASQSLQLYFEIDTKTGKIKLGISHTQSQVQKGSSTDIGPFHGGESKEMETTRDLNTSDGGTKTKDDKTYQEKETGGVGPVTTEESNDETTTKTDLGSKAEINVGLVGVEMGTTIEYTKETKDKKSTTTTDNQGKTEMKKEEDKKPKKTQ